MPSHCPACCGRVVTTDGVAYITGEIDCPGCQECERLRPQLEQAAKAAGLEKTECERLQRMLTHANEDWADTNTKIRDILRPILGAQETDGDSYGVPTLEYIVGRVGQDYERLRARLVLAERVCVAWQSYDYRKMKEALAAREGEHG